MADPTEPTGGAPPAASSTPPAAPLTEPASPPSGDGGAAPPEPKPVEPAVELAKPEPPKPADEPLPTDEPTMLEKAIAEGKKKAEGEKPKEGAAEPPKPDQHPTVTYDFKDYTFPEGMNKPVPETLKAFNDLLIQPDLSPQDRGQKLVDMHLGEMTNYARFLEREQHRQFAETRRQWNRETMQDAELGGSGHETAMAAVARMRDLFVPDKHKEAFDRFLKTTGAGDNTAFLRMMYYVAKRFDEPSPPKNVGFKPPSDIGRKPSGSKDGRRESLYDHPSSVQRRGG